MINNTEKMSKYTRDEFLHSLEIRESEQFYQSMLEDNTQFIPHEFKLNHGIHFRTVFRKVPFGADYCCDFMYLSKSTVKWHCVLVEIEKPSSRYFRNSTSQFHSDFQRARDQISSWRAWLNKSSNAESFLGNSLSQFRTPISRTPVEFKFVLVHGRRAEIAESEIRASKIHAEERSDFRIMSYDSLCEDLESKQELYVAVRKNEYVQIVSKRFVCENLFRWTSPSFIKINLELLEELKKVHADSLSVRPEFSFVEGKLRDSIGKFIEAGVSSER